MIAQTRLTPDRAEGVDFDRARSLMLGLAEALPPETIRLDDAHGRIVAATMVADDDLVPYARSAMDGYALRAADTVRNTGERVVLPIVGSLYAGDMPRELAPGQAMAVATGAPLPPGADAVIPIEYVVVSGDSIVLSAALEAGQYVFDAGDDAKRGDILVRRGDAVSPGRAALLAAAGHASIRVHRRPRVTVVCTGDEVVAFDERPAAGQIRNSNATMLAGHLADDGAELVACLHAGDSAGPLQARLRDAIAVSDVVITTGGASVGERDLVKQAFVALGTRFAFRSIALRPAKPMAFGRCGRALVAVLPGNPAAAFVAYTLLVRGAIRRLGGRAQAFPDTLGALLDGSIHAKAERHFVLFGRLTHTRGAFSVEPLGNQCSSLVRTSAEANALIIVPPGRVGYRAGDVVGVEVLDWSAVAFAS